MIDHTKKAVSGEEYDQLLAQLYPGELDQFGHVNMRRLRADCVAKGARPISVEHTWDDRMMVYFLAEQAGLITPSSALLEG
jgi:hypothetical protein